jgi:hypothetical protein
VILDIFSELQPGRPAEEVDARALFEELLEQARWGDERPAGEFVNDQRAMFTFVHCAETRRQAVESRAGEAAPWFMNSAPRVFRVERANWVNLMRGAIGDGDTCRRKLRRLAAQGLDRLLCLMQFGPIPHEAALRSIRLVGEHLLPELHAEPRRPRAVG